MGRDARQSGETLVETLITVVLLGLLGVGIVAAMASVISVSDLDAKQSGAETVLRSYAQAWNRAPYVSCTASQSTNPYGCHAATGLHVAGRVHGHGLECDLLERHEQHPRDVRCDVPGVR